MGPKKLKKYNVSERVTGVPINPYSGAVLIGNWFEERSKYEKSIIPWCTWNSTDYTQKNKPQDNDEFWKNRYKGNGIPIHRMFGQGDTDEFLKNQTTVHDLSYHHIFKDPLGKCYGIQTKTGLQKKKETEWAEFRIVNSYKTSYKVHYQEYPLECLQMEHQKAHDCDEYIQEPNQPDKCVLYKRVPLKIMPGL